MDERRHLSHPSVGSMEQDGRLGRDLGGPGEPDLVGDLRGAALLDAWEQAAGLSRPWAELSLLAAASGIAWEHLARLPIGRRDSQLLALHERLFGEALECESACPACTERVELTLDARRLRGALAGTDAAAEPTQPRGSAAVLELGGRTVRLRLPDSLDLDAALRAEADGRDPESVVLERCLGIDDPRPEGRPGPDSIVLSNAARDRIAGLMAELDPLAELAVALECPSCGHSWTESLDPATFLFRELEQRAVQLMSEVDVLARTYGWPESDILALSAGRRQRYVELALA